MYENDDRTALENALEVGLDAGFPEEDLDPLSHLDEREAEEPPLPNPEGRRARGAGAETARPRRAGRP